ncbi:hypothetical protein [Methanocaldococcus sp.]
MDLIIYMFLWGMAIGFFVLSFAASEGLRVVFNVMAFILFIAVALSSTPGFVTTKSVLVVNNTVQTVYSPVQGIIYAGYMGWLLAGFCVLRAIQHSFVLFSKGEE